MSEIFVARICFVIIAVLISSECVAQEQKRDSIMSQKQDSIMATWLNETVVTADRMLYTVRPDVITYNASADSSLAGKNSFEALRNAPLLRVERNGSVRSLGDWPIEYLVNGAHDHSLAGNIRDALESLDAKYLKRIEVRIIRGVGGQEILQINFVTKGRLLGYRGVVNSSLSDARWSNGAYLFSKRNRIGVSASYYNTWMWNHDEEQHKEEWRYDQSDVYHTRRETRETGYKVDLNNIEMNLSYEVSQLKLFSAFARVLLKANPHNQSTTYCCVADDVASMTYQYRNIQQFKVDHDAEYNVSLDYEQLFGENAERGKFYVGYDFYYRPIKTCTEGIYSMLETVEPHYIKDFYNNSEKTSNYENWHTVNVLYRRKISPHQLFVEDALRYRDEQNEMLQERLYIFDSEQPGYRKSHEEQYKHWQLQNELKIGYGYSKNKISANAGATYIFMRDYAQQPLLHNSFSSNRHLVTPYTDFTYAPNGKTNIRLSYVMGRQVADIGALDPYVETGVPGQISYGNPNLKPQTQHALSLSSNMRLGKFNLYASSSHSFARQLILQHSFLRDGMLHITMNNIGRRYETVTSANVSSKVTKTTWMQMGAKLYYTDYAKNMYYKRNNGCAFSVNAYVEQELPCNFDISANGGYNTSYVYMQGRGGQNFYYGITLYKSFPKRRLTFSAEANSFLPVYYNSTSTSSSTDFYSIAHRRGFHASFQVNIRWRFGKLKAEERKVDEHIEHDDIKRSYDE
ncbi:MAG: TonB-dependent receptor [Bacteroidaceae bacterium]|nr:TonB-dependent receptor [Bacteroidaceae bacterium]